MNLGAITANLTINMVRAIIFDMDGVIIDSEPVYGKWLAMFLESQGVAVPKTELNKIPGIASQDFVKKLELWWKNAGKPYKTGKEINQMFDKYSDGFPISYKNILTPNIKEVMEWLRQSHYKIAVASSSPMKNITEVLSETKLNTFVDIKVSGEAFANSKPNPEIYNFTVKKLGLEKAECIAVEDSSYGIQAAANARLKVIAKKDDRFGFDQSLADYHIDNLLQIIDILKCME